MHGAAATSKLGQGHALHSTVQVFGDKVPTPALASKPRAHEGAHRA